MNNTKKVVLALAGIFTTTLSTHLFAVCSLPNGVYVAGGIGMSRTTGKTYANSTTIVNYGKGWGFAAGYKFMPYFGAELGYNRYASTSIRNANGNTAAQDSHYSIDLAGKFIVPFKNSGLEPYLKLGLAYNISKIGSVDPTLAAVNNMSFNTGSNNSLGLYIGAGVQFFFTESFAGYLQYEQARGNSNTGNMQLASAGFSLLF